MSSTTPDPALREHIDEWFDVVVVGSGGGALVGAYAAASRGLRTLVVESTDRFGGTTAYSGAGLWLPGNHILADATGEDRTVDDARAYLRSVVGERTAALQDAFLAATGPMVSELVADELLQFEYRPFPDYFADAPHARPMGRDIFPLDLPRTELGELGASMRPSLPEERLGAPPPDVLTGGQALIGRLLLALSRLDGCELRTSHEMIDLLDDGSATVGIVASTPDGEHRIGARSGVLLASGGFERNAELRRRYGVPGRAEWTMGAPGGIGTPIEAGIRHGAAVDLLDQAWWSPGVMHPDGSSTFTLGVRAGVFVNGAGERFANESLPYDRFGREVIAGERSGVPHLPFWFVFDDREGGELPALSMVPVLDRAAYVDAGIWHTADTLEDLADAIGVPADALVRTVSRFNGFAADGVDEDFHRGEAPFDTFFATGPGPNPALVPVEQGPFHAVQFGISDLGTKGGLVTDTVGRVQRADGSTMTGLYAAGNTMASLTEHTYPAPGCPIGTCMVFSYLAALDMAERARPD